MADRPWVRRVVSEAFASPRIVSRGVLHAVDDLPGFLAEEAGQPVGLLLYHMGSGECEVVVLLSLQEGKGVATTLLAEAAHVARGARCRRLWLVATNVGKDFFLWGAVQEALKAFPPTRARAASASRPSLRAPALRATS